MFSVLFYFVKYLITGVPNGLTFVYTIAHFLPEIIGGLIFVALWGHKYSPEQNFTYPISKVLQ